MAITVTSFDPGVDGDQVGLAVEGADEGRAGIGAHGEARGVRVIEEPLSHARQQHDVVGLAVGDQDIGEGSAEVPHHRGHRPRAAGIQPRTGLEGDVVALGIVEQDRHLVGALVGDNQVEPGVVLAVADVGHGDPNWVGAHEVTIPVIDRRPELAVAQPGIDQDVVAAAVGDNQIRGIVRPVQFSQRHGAGVEQAGGLIGQDGRIAGTIVDDHAIESLVGVDDVLGAIAGQVGNGQLDRLVGVSVGLEGSIALAEQHQDVAVGVADQEVEFAVAVDVDDGQAVGFDGTV